MTEKDKYIKLIASAKIALESLRQPQDWEKFAELVTSDQDFQKNSTDGSIRVNLQVDNLPVALRHLLPNTNVNASDAVDLAIAFGMDTTIDEACMRPFGQILVNNLGRMRELLPPTK